MKLPIPANGPRVAYAFNRSTTATIPGLQGSAVAGSTGGAVTNATTYREVLCVAGHASARVRMLTVTSTGTLTLTPVRPEVSPAGIPDEAVQAKDGALDPTKVVKYGTGFVTKAVAAAVETVADIVLSGENYILVEFACTATGTLTYCDAASVDYTSVPTTDWAQGHTGAAAGQSTSTRAAAGAGVKHVCTSISATFTTGATAQAAPAVLNLRDGATGAGNVLWVKQAILPVNGIWEVNLSGLNIVGTPNTAMTLEFNAAGAAGTYESVSMSGHDIT